MQVIPGTLISVGGKRLFTPTAAGTNGQVLSRTGESSGVVQLGWSNAAGVSDHTGLSNLAWNASGHTGTADTLAAFSGAGAATFQALSDLEQVANKGAANGYAGLDANALIPAANIPAIAITEYLGSVANEAAMLALAGEKGDWCIRSDSGAVWIITGADPSLIGDWTQVSYPAAPVSSVAGRTGDVTLSDSDVSGLGTASTHDVPASGDAAAGEVVKGNDSRLTDNRTPTAHASTHQSGGADAIKLDDLAAPDDNTDLNATTSAHGLLPKLSGTATEFLDGTGAFSTPAGGSVDAHQLFAFRDQVVVRFNLLDFSVGGTGSGSGSILSARRSYTASGTTSGSGYCRSFHNQEHLGLSPGTHPVQLNWAKKVTLSFLLSPVYDTTNGIDRLYLGGDDVTTVQDIPTKGIGAYRKNTAIYGVCRNGGSLIEIDLTTTLAASSSKVCAITCTSDGAGNVTWWIDGVQAGTSTSGPTGTSTSAHVCFHQSSSNNADNSNQACILHDAVAILNV